MPTRPPLTGLLKHQIMLTSYAPEDTVTTIWTYKAAIPVTQARVTYEQGAIKNWLTAQWRTVTRNTLSAVKVKTWDMGTAIPTRFAHLAIVPSIVGQISVSGNTAPRYTTAVVALRSQPIGSLLRDRMNGRIAHSGLATVSDDTPQNPSSSSIQNVYTSLKTTYLNPTVNVLSGNWVVVSYFHNGVVRAAPVVVTIDHVLVRSIIGVQRRRQARATAYARGA